MRDNQARNCELNVPGIWPRSMQPPSRLQRNADWLAEAIARRDEMRLTAPAKAMAAAKEDWSEWDSTAEDGLDPL